MDAVSISLLEQVAARCNELARKGRAGSFVTNTDMAGETQRLVVMLGQVQQRVAPHFTDGERDRYARRLDR